MGGLADLWSVGQWWERDHLRVRIWLKTPLRRWIDMEASSQGQDPVEELCRQTAVTSRV